MAIARKTILAAGLLLVQAWAAVVPARAGLEIGGGALTGSRDYAERSLSVKLRLPWRGSDDFEQPLYTLHAGRTGRDRSGSPGVSFTNELGFGAEYLRQVGFHIALWTTPSFSEDVRSYRWRSWSGSLYAKNDGWWPAVRIAEPPRGGGVQCLWRAGFRQTTHEERVQPAGQPVRWTKINELAVFGGVEEKFRTRTAVGAEGEFRSYDRDLESAVRRGELFSAERASAGLPLPMLQGFPGGSWEITLTQDLARGISLRGGFRRYAYETGPARAWQNYRAVLTMSLPGFLSASGRYEVFRARRQRTAEYAGMDVGIEF